jgi:hypothetical protein
MKGSPCDQRQQPADAEQQGDRVGEDVDALLGGRVVLGRDTPAGAVPQYAIQVGPRISMLRADQPLSLASR